MMTPLLDLISRFLIGLLFGVGLVVAGMSDPAKILNFLDLAAIPVGQWDPSLAFVLIGAVTVTALGYHLARGRRQPLLGEQFHLPPTETLDRRLILGAAIFGIGWGMVGFCPGPALTALGFGSGAAFLFMGAMLAGMVAARWAARATRKD